MRRVYCMHECLLAIASLVAVFCRNRFNVFSVLAGMSFEMEEPLVGPRGPSSIDADIAGAIDGSGRVAHA